MMINNLFEKDLYLNENNPFMFNTEIIEYDMKDAGFSLTKEFNLLPEKTIDILKDMDKNIRTKRLGVIQRDNKEYAENLKHSFKTARKLFFLENDISNDNIISIKKDAIFTCKKCKKQQITKNILFRPKNTYTSYINLGHNIEIYYSPLQTDVKGISEINIKKHEDYMLSFIKSFINKMETEDSHVTIGFTKRFIDKYKWRELDTGYYRTFDSRSIYELFDDNIVDNIEEGMTYNINYNFYNILLKLVTIPL